MVVLLFWGFHFEKSHTEIKSYKRSPTGVLHCPCVVCFDLETLGRTLRLGSITSDSQRLCKNVALLLFGSSMSSKDVAFTSRGKNVWQSVCLLVSWSCRPISTITTGNDRLFALKSLQSFSLFLLSLETQGIRQIVLRYTYACAQMLTHMHCCCSALTVWWSLLRALLPNAS